MTVTERFEAAGLDAWSVLSAQGLLAEFNDAGVLAPTDVHAATAVARLFDETDEQAILAAAMVVRGTRFGHVCIRLADLEYAVAVDGVEAEVIEALPWPEADEWQAALDASPLSGRPGSDTPLIIDGARVYLERYHRYEQLVAKLIIERCPQPLGSLTPAADSMLKALLAQDGESTRQYEAAKLALTAPFSVVVGGPGTGKTYTIGAMLAALAAGESTAMPLVGVCAPTGKAAARLGEAITQLATDLGPEIRERMATVTPSTMHRLLGWRPDRGRFRHEAANRLPHDLVIVDEMSMVSLPMTAKLLAAVRDDAAVVFVGDPFQLESIEAGTVLADIAGQRADDEPPTRRDAPIAHRITVLDRAHRFEADSVIADFAEAVRDGDETRAIELLEGDDEHLRWVPSRDHPAFGELWAAVIDQRRRMVELSRQQANEAETLAALNELAVLCAHRRGPDSVRDWARDIEAELDEIFTGLRWKGEWYPGRPVMITKNDRNLDLYNGDIGVAVGDEANMRVAFDGTRIRMFPLTQLGEHETVHAMTIHKAQGSQFDEIVVVLPSEGSRLLTRELLYTAVTRARTRVWLAGREGALAAAVDRSVDRASGLGEALWADSSAG